MPLIEELPVSTIARPSHGWTYIPDHTGSVATATLGSRKRGRDGDAARAQSAQKLSAKQEKAIQQRLNDLGKDNYREANIPVPKRDGARGKDRKTTQNVRRILAYSRTFQHYLADEEAGVNVYGSAGIVPSSSSGAHAGQGQTQKAGDSRRRGAANDTAAGQKATSKRTGSLKLTASRKSTPAPIKAEPQPAGTDVEMTDAPPHPPQRSQPSSPSALHKSPHQKQPLQTSSSQGSPETPVRPYDPASDRDPLLRTRDLPKMPSNRVMQALLAEPSLSYRAARATTSTTNTETGAVIYVGSGGGTAKPQRWFCAVCGYWGKLRCKYGCGERVCGLLECWRSHEGVCTANVY